jgi:class 3 adenylate cyclase
VGDADALVDEIEEYMTGARSGAEGDVRTMTVLFTDIVASTEHQARVGQREWSRLTDRHDATVRSALSRHRGYEVKTTADGFVATFDATARALRRAGLNRDHADVVDDGVVQLAGDAGSLLGVARATSAARSRSAVGALASSSATSARCTRTSSPINQAGATMTARSTTS